MAESANLEPPRFTATRLIIYAVFAILAVEVLIVQLLERLFGDISHPVYELIEPLLLIVLIIPILYFTLYRPVSRYLTHLRSAAEKIDQLRNRYRSLVESTDDSIYLIDPEYRYLFVNKKHLERLGLPGEQVIGRSYRDFHVPVEIEDFNNAVDHVFKTGESVIREHLSSRDGKTFLRTLSPVRDSKGTVIAVTVISKDISILKKMENQLKTLSITDDLTGICNRRGFYYLAVQQMKNAKRAGKRMVLLFADVDGLKIVNDRFGHQAGDATLIAATAVLQETFRDSDVLARIGGDEFGIVPVNINGDDVDNIIQRLQRNIDSFNTRGLLPRPLSMSVGASVLDPGTSLTLDQMMACADQAMYEHKKQKYSKTSK